MSDFRFFTEAHGNPFRLGRHQIHSALLPAKAAPDPTVEIHNVTHHEFVPCFDQGNLGSCTANAALGCLVTAPFGHVGVAYTEADAVELYKLETTLDDSQIPGSYPPHDTGSSGAWSMLALEKQGKIASFTHTRTTYAALCMLTGAPVSLGVPWFSSMFHVKNGFVTVDPSSGLAGGHQVCLVGVDTGKQAVKVRNSWGSGWGDDGHAWLAWRDLNFLLSQGGDVVQPVMS